MSLLRSEPGRFKSGYLHHQAEPVAVTSSGLLLDHNARDCPPEAMIVDANIAV